MSGIFKELPENNKKERSQLINREKVRTGNSEKSPEWPALF